ncbi:MAG: hypothetical protein H7A45_17910 [Verrucomicrobiales bacterium]|nr:hypothetical protein [Verrucomicrobiales bacterium]MCP5525439.1 hypothetical protein [Verrucomicrobiales bacterium]
MSLPFIIAVCVVAVIEILLSSSWNGFYYRFGLPVFRSRMSRTDLNRLSSRWLTQQHLHVYPLPLRFMRLGQTAIAFREGIGPLHYTPIMHGVIRRNRGRQPGTSIVGYLNWTPALLLLGLVVEDLWHLAHGRLSFPIGATALMMGIMMYIFQARRLVRLSRMISENLNHVNAGPKPAAPTPPPGGLDLEAAAD